MSRIMRNPTFCICENKDADLLISAFVFATRIVHFLYFVNKKIQPIAIFSDCTHGGNTIGTTCVVDRDDTAYMVVDREFRLPTEQYGCRYTTQTQCVVNRTSKTRENRFLIIADRQRGITTNI